MDHIDGATRKPTPIRALVAVVGLVSLFVPFTSDYSPWRAMFEGFWMYGGPAFLTLTITTGYLRSVPGKGLTRTERNVYYGLGILGVLTMLYPWVWSLIEEPSSIDLGSSWLASLIVLSGLLLLIPGLFLVFRVSRMQHPPEAPPVLLMRVVYVANAVNCLAGFFGGWQVGACLVLLVTVVYVGIIGNVVRAVIGDR